MSESVGGVQLDLGINYKGFNKQLNGIASNAQSMVGGAFKGVGKLVAGAFAVKTVFDFGKASIGLASNLTEVQNVVDTTFRGMSGQVNTFAKNALESFGLSELSAKRYTSTIGAMFKSSGIMGQQLVTMSEGVTGLAGDFASFYNLNTDDAFAKIRSGLSGETEPLKQLGINMSVANMEAFALSKGITKSYMAMNQAEQTLLRYNYLLETSKDAQGDFAKTSGTWANQTRLLGEQWKIFQTTMGQGFINALTPAIKWINFIIAKLQIAAQYFKAFTEMLFGSAQQSSGAAVEVTDSMDGMGSATEDAGKATKKAGKAVKGSLSSFDQLNLLSQNTAGSMEDMADSAAGIGGGVGPDAGPGSLTPTVDVSGLQPLKDFFDGFKVTLGEIGGFLSTTFGPTLQGIINQSLPILDGWKQSFLGLFGDVTALGEPLKAWLINDMVPFWQTEFAVMGNTFNGLLDSGKMVFDSLEGTLMPILQKFVTDGLPVITQFTTGALEVFNELFNQVKSIFDMLWAEGVQPGLDVLKNMINDAIGSIKDFWDKWGGDIIQGAKDMVKNIGDTFKGWWETFLKPIWDEICKTVQWLWDKHLKSLVDGFLDFVGKVVTGAMDIYNKFIAPMVQWFTKVFGPPIANAFQLVVDVLGTVIGVISDVVKGILKSLGGLVDFIVGVFTGDWRKAWNGIKAIFGGIWDAVEGILKGVVNVVIDAINWLIRGMNKVSFDVPDWVPGIGGQKVGINIPQIPKLAQGGLAYGPQLAMVGDNPRASSDPEVISPLSQLQAMLGNSNQAVVAVLNLILDAIKGNNRQLILQMNETELGRVAIDAINAYQRQAGQTLLIV